MYLEIYLIFNGLINYSQVKVFNCCCHLKSNYPAGVLHGAL